MIKNVLDIHHKLIHGYYKVTYPQFIRKLLAPHFDSLVIKHAHPVTRKPDLYNDSYFQVDTDRARSVVKFVLDGVYYEIIFDGPFTFGTRVKTDDISRMGEAIHRVLKNELRSSVRPPIRSVDYVSSRQIASSIISSDKLSFV